MSFDALKSDMKQMKEIIREIYVFTSQLDNIKNLETGSNIVINAKEKKLLNETILSLTNELRILNNSLPKLVHRIGFFKQLAPGEMVEKEKLIQMEYQPRDAKEKVSVTIEGKDKKEFVENLSKGGMSKEELKKEYSSAKPASDFVKPNAYAKISNRFFRYYSNRLIVRGYFGELNEDLRRINSPFILGTYVSMILFAAFISFIASIFVFGILLFFNVSPLFPFISFAAEPIILRAVKFFWVLLAFPLIPGVLMYYYPSSEGKNIGKKIDHELPFVTIHMSAIATSGVEPLSIFKIILKSAEYKYVNIEFRKLMNLINFHGKDLVSALKMTAKTSPSQRLADLLDGLSTTITSGGDISDFLNNHAETLLFDYKLEREKYTKASETFMDIYISIAIAAPMILLMLFVIMGSTGLLINFIGLGTDVLSMLIIIAIAFLNIGFLIFLKFKQPVI
jgi:Flp pilus assembly protein TadB